MLLPGQFDTTRCLEIHLVCLT